MLNINEKISHNKLFANIIKSKNYKSKIEEIFN